MNTFCSINGQNGRVQKTRPNGGFIREICILFFFVFIGLLVPLLMTANFGKHWIDLNMKYFFIPLLDSFDLLFYDFTLSFPLLVFLPYILFLVLRRCIRRGSLQGFQKLGIIIASCIFLFASYFFVLNFIFDCHIRDNKINIDYFIGYFKGKYRACYTINEGYPCTQKVYFMRAVDFDTFVVLGAEDDYHRSYAKDKNHVYYDYLKSSEGCGIDRLKIDGIVRGSTENSGMADPITFEILNKTYSKDKNSNYCNGIKLNMSDVESFEITGGNTAKDKNYEYKNCEILSE